MIKQMAPFLDPHLLLLLLAKNTDAKQTGALQTQIKGKLLLSNAAKAKELEESTKAEASKLIDIINSNDHAKMREEHRFTLEVLKKEKAVTIQDCKSLQKYAKVLYESGKYKGKKTRQTNL